MQKSKIEKIATEPTAAPTTKSVKVKQWEAPVLLKLNINCTYGRTGAFTDSDGSSSCKS